LHKKNPHRQGQQPARAIGLIDDKMPPIQKIYRDLPRWGITEMMNETA
jgi:hypothetical protein